MDEPLELLVAPGALGPELPEFAVAPDHPAREQHRASWPVPLLEHERTTPVRMDLRRSDEAGHPRAGYDDSGRLIPARNWACAPRTRGGCLRDPDEDGDRVRRIDDPVDLESELLCFPSRALRRVDQQSHMVEKGPLRAAGAPGTKSHESPAERKPFVVTPESHSLQPLGRPGRILHGEHIE